MTAYFKIKEHYFDLLIVQGVHQSSRVDEWLTILVG